MKNSFARDLQSNPLRHRTRTTRKKGNTRFREFYLGRETKKRVVRMLVGFQEPLSVISFKRCRRELSIDVAERWSILKNKGVVRIFVIFQDRPMPSHIL